MKTILIVLSLFAITNLYGQNNAIFGKFTKNDGVKLNGTSVYKGFENQVIINNYTGGSDNTATIDIEVPTAAYVSDFRNLMNTAAQPANNSKPVLPASTKTNVPATTIRADIKKTNLQTTQVLPKLASAEINVVTLLADAKSSKPINKIILQDITVVSVTDNIATGKSIIKLRGNRIGWIYYSYGTGGKISNAAKSGWDVTAGTAWTNF